MIEWEAHAVFIRTLISMGGLGLFLALELWRPYRPATVSKFRRWAVNLGLTIINGAAITWLFAGMVIATAHHVTQHKIGLLNMLALPYWAKLLVTVAFLDFMLYIWHLLNHEVPLLWRFHRVHHTDLDMDVSTATRFHMGELIASVFVRMGLIYVIGADFLGVLVFETLVVATAQFHHSSLDVPAGLERFIWPLFVPPSMHRIHHSVRIKERNSNYGTIFSLWDRTMGTMISDVDQSRLRLGVGGHFDNRRLGLGGLLVMPFTPPVR